MISVRGHTIPDADLTWRFSRASGPGGQHVNTTDTRVQLSYDVAGSEVFPPDLKERLLARLGAEVTVVAADQRSQFLNRRAAQERLVERLEEALRPPPRPRVGTKPSKGARRRRMDDKRRRGETKRLRSRPHGD